MSPYRKPAPVPMPPAEPAPRRPITWLTIGMSLYVATVITLAGLAIYEARQLEHAPCETFIGQPVDVVPRRCTHPPELYQGPPKRSAER